MTQRCDLVKNSQAYVPTDSRSKGVRPWWLRPSAIRLMIYRKSRQPRLKAEWGARRRLGKERSAGRWRSLPRPGEPIRVFCGRPARPAPQSRQPHVNLARAGPPTIHSFSTIQPTIALFPTPTYYRQDRSVRHDRAPAAELVQDN